MEHLPTLSGVHVEHKIRIKLTRKSEAKNGTSLCFSKPVPSLFNAKTSERVRQPVCRVTSAVSLELFTTPQAIGGGRGWSFPRLSTCSKMRMHF